jgi:hypothetical protein
MAALIGGKRQYDGPLIFEAQKRFDTVFAHVGRNGNRIATELIEKGFSVHAAGVANVAPFGIGNDKVLLANVFDGAGQSLPAFEGPGLRRKLDWVCRPRSNLWLHQ